MSKTLAERFLEKYPVGTVLESISCGSKYKVLGESHYRAFKGLNENGEICQPLTCDHDHWKVVSYPEPRELTFGEAMCAFERGEDVQWFDDIGCWCDSGWDSNIIFYMDRKFRIKPKLTPRHSVEELKKLARLTGGE